MSNTGNYTTITAGGGGGTATFSGVTNGISNSYITSTTYSGTYRFTGAALGPSAAAALGHLFTIEDANQKRIVTLKTDGEVVWDNGVNINDAAEAFSQSIQAGALLSAGITNATKLRMRDSVFADLIEIAKDKGSLTAEDLTYLLQASKIVEKLKGPKE